MISWTAEYWSNRDEKTVAPLFLRVRSTTIVQTGPYRFSRNPIYLAFILFVLGLSVWLNNAWLLVTDVPAVGVIAMIVIPREERFLESNFKEDHFEIPSNRPPLVVAGQA